MIYYKHIKTGNIYTIREKILMENPETHEWIQGIIYSQAATRLEDGKYEKVYEWCAKSFTRSESRFNERFEPIEEKDIDWKTPPRDRRIVIRERKEEEDGKNE